MIEKLKQKLREWLEIDVLEKGLSSVARDVRKTRRDFDEQMSCVGVDVHLRKSPHTTVIFVSRLGQHGEGTIRAVETYFKTYREMVDFMKMLEAQQEPPQKFVIDAPPGFSDDYRQRWP